MLLFAEIKRRAVFRAATVYVAVSWLLTRVAETTFAAFGLGDGKLRVLMVALLARIPELRVISRTSAFAFKGKDVGIAEIAEHASGFGGRVPLLPAEVYASTGRPEQARERLDRIEQPRYIDPWSPLLQPLALDARWRALCARFGPTLDEIEAVESDPPLPRPRAAAS